MLLWLAELGSEGALKGLAAAPPPDTVNPQ